MLKSRTGTDRSDHTTTWARIAVAEALFTENRVVIPFPFARSTSKYGNSKVAAGTSSIVQMTAPAGIAIPRMAMRTRHSTALCIADPLLGFDLSGRSISSRRPLGKGSSCLRHDPLAFELGRGLLDQPPRGVLFLWGGGRGVESAR